MYVFRSGCFICRFIEVNIHLTCNILENIWSTYRRAPAVEFKKDCCKNKGIFFYVHKGWSHQEPQNFLIHFDFFSSAISSLYQFPYRSFNYFVYFYYPPLPAALIAFYEKLSFTFFLSYFFLISFFPCHTTTLSFCLDVKL